MKIVLARDVTITDIDSGVVLLDGRRGRYWQLNRTGAHVLNSLLQAGDPESAAALLASAAPVSQEQALQDVTTLIESLASSRLVEVSQ